MNEELANLFCYPLVFPWANTSHLGVSAVKRRSGIRKSARLPCTLGFWPLLQSICCKHLYLINIHELWRETDYCCYRIMEACCLLQVLHWSWRLRTKQQLSHLKSGSRTSEQDLQGARVKNQFCQCRLVSTPKLSKKGLLYKGFVLYVSTPYVFPTPGKFLMYQLCLLDLVLVFCKLYASKISSFHQSCWICDQKVVYNSLSSPSSWL